MEGVGAVAAVLGPGGGEEEQCRLRHGSIDVEIELIIEHPYLISFFNNFSLIVTLINT